MYTISFLHKFISVLQFNRHITIQKISLKIIHLYP